MLLPTRVAKYPWRNLALGESFFIEWSKEEKRWGHKRKARRSALESRAWRMGRWKLAFSIHSTDLGLLITRVVWPHDVKKRATASRA